ncbi:hypothetical protein BC835DRAFT_1525086 [Cytidiella melzeri]|nr:hypothetical protein BC835DRAFT_1525086 [Cytidiella melzeri]
MAGTSGSRAGLFVVKLERARRRKQKGKETEESYGVPIREDMEKYIDSAWELVRQDSVQRKIWRQWKTLQLDDFEADMARYVLFSLYHHAQEVEASLQPQDAFRGSNAYSSPIWRSATGLKVSSAPSQPHTHIRGPAYKLWCTAGPGLIFPSPKSRRLAELLTVKNVRKALSVDPGESFGIWELPITQESEGLRFGIYPIPSLFNHNCSPNVCKERNGRRLHFVITRDVSAGDEMCISYGHVENLSFEQRRQELLDGWFFFCQCSRCLAEESVTRARFPPAR